MPFMRYVLARFNERQREEAYRICVSDSLRIITENTANFAGGKRFTARYYDIVNPKPKETRTADEVITNIRTKLDKLGGKA